VRTGSDCAGEVLLPVVGVARAGQAGAGRVRSRCQQARKSSVHGQSGANGEGALPGMAGQPGRQVRDPVAERVRVCATEFLVAAVAEEAGTGGEVGGDVRGEDPSCVDLPSLRGEVAQAHGLGSVDPGRLDGGVVAVQHVDVLGMVAARDWFCSRVVEAS
jgi:hypothetical protein